MKFRFDASQDYQIQAVESIAGLFEGQNKIGSGILYAAGAGFVGAPNKLDLSEDEVLRNLRYVQSTNGLPVSTNLEFIKKQIATEDGKKEAKFPNFSVEMETGTGKTYVYIRTALELNKRYGFRRFIIVVPSVAVKEGVLKTFEITRSHFLELYDNQPYRSCAYDSANLSQIRQLVSSSNVEFMIMTLDSFNKAMTQETKGNVIRRPTDRLQGATPIFVVQASRPILILDEPQNMESVKSVEALAALDPLFAIRYSATHRNPYNLVYRLGPAEAYSQGLVKKIEVASVLREDDLSQVYMRIDKITSIRKTVTATMVVNRLMLDGTVKQKSVTVRPGDGLRDKTNLPEYEKFTVEEINPGSNRILFSNGVEMEVGESRGADKESIFEAQIRYTIEEHLRKQARFRNRKIKVLSLFFIDRVENYASESGCVRRAFIKGFDEAKQRYSDWKDLSAEEVQASYFASTKRKGAQIKYQDTSGKSKKDEEAYDLIMKDKERLLSSDTKQAFIFSHSALREGWDNPNIFQICTLNQTSSEIKKRQEIGRGIRLAVDETGDRIRDSQVNLLTVVANESYDQYVRQLQSEIVAEYGEGVVLPPKPANARKRTMVSPRKEFVLSSEFKELWEKIKTKTRYLVNIETEKLVEDVLKDVDSLEIRPPRIKISKAQFELDELGSFEAHQIVAPRPVIELRGRYPLPNLVDEMAYLLENTTPRVCLTRKSLLEIFLRTKNQKGAVDNPFEFASAVTRILKGKLADHLIKGIQYEKINEWYEMSRIMEPFEAWEDYVIPAERSVYDKVEFDSEQERRFVEDIEKMQQVKMYIKLPSWFKVTTPVGDYNPDWALVWEDRDEHGDSTGKPLLYLVRETKGKRELDKLRPEEGRKITCATRHFKDTLGVDYEVVTTATELP